MLLTLTLSMLMADADGPPAVKNIEGTPLQICSKDPLTGWFRDGSCRTDAADRGSHLVCAEMTEAFLSFTKSRGNDLSTPRGSFPGLKPGERWCLCALRWKEADDAGVAPPVVLDATHEDAARLVDPERLRAARVKPTK